MAHSTAHMQSIPDNADQLIEDFASEADVLDRCRYVRQRNVFFRKILHEVEMISRFDPALYANQTWMRGDLGQESRLSQKSCGDKRVMRIKWRMFERALITGGVSSASPVNTQEMKGEPYQTSFGILDLVDRRELASAENSFFPRDEGILGNAMTKQFVR